MKAKRIVCAFLACASVLSFAGCKNAVDEESVNKVIEDQKSVTDITAIYSAGQKTSFLAIKKDKSVVAVGAESDATKAAAGFKDVEQLAVYSDVVAALKTDGTVVTSSEDYDVSSWKDIKEIAINYGEVVGLKKDGTVVSTNSETDYSAFTGVKAIFCSDDSIIVGIKDDGTLVTNSKEFDEKFKVSSFKDVAYVVASEGTGIACVLNDGTVAYEGFKSDVFDKDGKVTETVETFKDAKSWTDLKKIVYAGFVLGLKKDGTVVIGGEAIADSVKEKVAALKDVADIESDGTALAVLKTDGTVELVNLIVSEKTENK